MELYTPIYLRTADRRNLGPGLTPRTGLHWAHNVWRRAWAGYHAKQIAKLTLANVVNLHDLAGDPNLAGHVDPLIKSGITQLVIKRSLFFSRKDFGSTVDEQDQKIRDLWQTVRTILTPSAQTSIDNIPTILDNLNQLLCDPSLYYKNTTISNQFNGPETLKIEREIKAQKQAKDRRFANLSRRTQTRIILLNRKIIYSLDQTNSPKPSEASKYAKHIKPFVAKVIQGAWHDLEREESLAQTPRCALVVLTPLRHELGEMKYVESNSPLFSEMEFLSKEATAINPLFQLCEAVNRAQYTAPTPPQVAASQPPAQAAALPIEINTDTTPHAIADLNQKIICNPDFINAWEAQHPTIEIPRKSRLGRLIRKTRAYSNENFADLTAKQRERIRLRNRLLLEEAHRECPQTRPKQLPLDYLLDAGQTKLINLPLMGRDTYSLDPLLHEARLPNRTRPSYGELSAIFAALPRRKHAGDTWEVLKKLFPNIIIKDETPASYYLSMSAVLKGLIKIGKRYVYELVFKNCRNILARIAANVRDNFCVISLRANSILELGDEITVGNKTLEEHTSTVSAKSNQLLIVSQPIKDKEMYTGPIVLENMLTGQVKYVIAADNHSKQMESLLIKMGAKAAKSATAAEILAILSEVKAAELTDFERDEIKAMRKILEQPDVESTKWVIRKHIDSLYIAETQWLDRLQTNLERIINDFLRHTAGRSEPTMLAREGNLFSLIKMVILPMTTSDCGESTDPARIVGDYATGFVKKIATEFDVSEQIAAGFLARVYHDVREEVFKAGGQTGKIFSANLGDGSKIHTLEDNQGKTLVTEEDQALGFVEKALDFSLRKADSYRYWGRLLDFPRWGEYSRVTTGIISGAFYGSLASGGLAGLSYALPGSFGWLTVALTVGAASLAAVLTTHQLPKPQPTVSNSYIGSRRMHLRNWRKIFSWQTLRQYFFYGLLPDHAVEDAPLGDNLHFWGKHAIFGTQLTAPEGRVDYHSTFVASGSRAQLGKGMNSGLSPTMLHRYGTFDDSARGAQKVIQQPGQLHTVVTENVSRSRTQKYNDRRPHSSPLRAGVKGDRVGKVGKERQEKAQASLRKLTLLGASKHHTDVAQAVDRELGKQISDDPWLRRVFKEVD